MRQLIAIFLALLTLAPLCAQSPTAEELNKSGIEYGEEKEYERAGQAFAESVLLFDRQASLAWYRKGMIQLERGDSESALSCFIEAAHRDPSQPEPLERAGYLYYRKGAYNDAVKHGEKVLSLDPENRQVKTWLPDAYRGRVTAMRKPSGENKAAPAVQSTPRPMFPPCGIYESTFFLEASAYVRTGYNSEEKSKYRYISSPGLVTNFPYTLRASYRLNEQWGLLGVFQNPYTGNGMPQVCSQDERLEVLFFAKKFVIGGGITIFHYKGDGIFGKSADIIDLKGGLSLLHRGKEADIELLFYPKFLIPDGAWSSGKTMDASRFQLKYLYKYSGNFRFYSRNEVNEYYFYDNGAGSARYYGSFVAAIGAHYDLYRLFRSGDLRLTGEIGKKIHLNKFREDKIYDFANGQGYLGLDLTGGDIFSGYHSSSTVFLAGVEERFSENFFFGQEFAAEIAGFKAPRSEFSLRITGGYTL